MAVYITASVGQSGRNQFNDVQNMQHTLNKFISAGHLAPNNYLVVDGKIGRLTINAIKTFQHRYLGFSRPDGRIDPGGRTLNALNAPVMPPPPGSSTGTGIGSSSTGGKTNKWAIALRAIHNGVAEFSLAKRATKEVKTLVIRNPSIKRVGVSKSFQERWVGFITPYQVSYRNFNGTPVAFITTGAGTHNMVLGGLAKIPVVPYQPSAFGGMCPANPSGIATGSIMGCELKPAGNSTPWGYASIAQNTKAPPGLRLVPSQPRTLILCG